MNLQATDLRIGNNIQWLHEESETILTVDSRMLSVIAKYNYDPDADEFSRGIWYAPIPLSAELLTAMGFTGLRVNVWRKGRVQVWGNMAYLLAEDMQEAHYIPTPVDYLHQLQNLYYALTGSELALKGKEV
jgi:hypothetical protein